MIDTKSSKNQLFLLGLFTINHLPTMEDAKARATAKRVLTMGINSVNSAVTQALDVDYCKVD